MAIQDYGTLTSAIKSWCARKDTTFATRIDDFIAYSEMRMNNGQGSRGEPLECPALNAPEMEISVPVPFVAGVGTVPTDASTVRSITRDTDTSGLTYLTPRQFDIFNAEGNQDLPSYYTVSSGQILVAPVYTGNLTVRYYQVVTPLTLANTTNVIIQKYPLLYLSGCLFEAFSFMQEVELAVAQFARYKAQVVGINESANSVRFGGGPLRIRTRNPIG